MTFLSAIGNVSIATAAISSATSAMIIRPLYGARNGTRERRGLRFFDLGLSEERGLSEDWGRSELLTKLEFAQVQLPPHAEIAREAVERMTKRRRPVVFEAVMTDPCKRVSRQQRGEQPPQVAGAD